MSLILYAKIQGNCKMDLISITGCCTKQSSIFKILEQLEEDNPDVTILKCVEENASKASSILLENHDLNIFVDGHRIYYCCINYELCDIALKLDHFSSVARYKKLPNKEWRIKCYDDLLVGSAFCFGKALSCRCRHGHLSLKQGRLRTFKTARVFPSKKKFNVESVDVPSLGSLFREDSEYSGFKVQLERIDHINNNLSNLLSY